MISNSGSKTALPWPLESMQLKKVSLRKKMMRCLELGTVYPLSSSAQKKRVYALKLGFKIHQTNFETQKIHGSTLKMFGIVLTSF